MQSKFQTGTSKALLMPGESLAANTSSIMHETQMLHECVEDLHSQFTAIRNLCAPILSLSRETEKLAQENTPMDSSINSDLWTKLHNIRLEVQSLSKRLLDFQNEVTL